MPDLILIGYDLVAERFQRTSDDRDRRPKCVGDGCRKIAPQLFQPVMLPARFIQPVAQDVDRRCQFADLVMLPDVRFDVVMAAGQQQGRFLHPGEGFCKRKSEKSGQNAGENKCRHNADQKETDTLICCALC